MMKPGVNFCNQTVCWMDGEVVFSNEDVPVAIIRSGTVFAVKNCHYLSA